MAKHKAARAPEPPGSNPADLEAALTRTLASSRKYVMPAAIGVVVIILVAIVVARQQGARDAARAEAFAALDEAIRNDASPLDTPEARTTKLNERKEKLKTVIELHPNSAAAVQATFLMARTVYELGNYAEAANAFADFAVQHPDAPPLTGFAYLGEANALVDAGKIEEAYEKFKLLGNSGGITDDEQVIAQAKYKAAVCAIALGQRDQALKLLEEIEASGAQDAMKQRARDLANRLPMLPEDILTQPVAAAADADAMTPTGAATPTE